MLLPVSVVVKERYRVQFISSPLERPPDADFQHEMATVQHFQFSFLFRDADSSAKSQLKVAYAVGASEPW
jgi:hypothetical protein